MRTIMPLPDRTAPAPRGRAPISVWLALLLVALPERPLVHAASPDFATFLAERKIDRQQRQVLEEPGAWNDARQKMLIRLLANIDVPAALMLPWAAAAGDVDGGAAAVGDALVRVRGRATFVAPQSLTDEQQVLAGSSHYDVVRIVSAGGAVVDVATRRAPRSWPRWKTIDEPAEAVGLPLATTGGPRPAPAPAEGAAWPSEPATLLLAADGIGWRPGTPLGRLGMDYALFDSVEDGRRIEGGDNAALFALLAAAGRPEAATVTGPDMTPERIVELIDPRGAWFAKHRGEPVTIKGIARKATRVAIDEPVRRDQVGADHYWEVFVFVSTPLLKVHDRLQDDYPIVCCLRELPAGFPTGDRIGEPVSVTGFTFKRYGYRMPDLDITSSQGDRETRGQRLETALVVGRTAVWTRGKPGAGATFDTLSTIFAALAAAVGLVLVVGAWRMRRDAARAEAAARARLPDRVNLPDERG
jgi:hypothetical protein